MAIAHILGIGALALYFYYRFHISGEQFPSMERSDMWFDVLGIVRDSSGVEYKYQTQYDSIKNLMEKKNILSKKVHY